MGAAGPWIEAPQRMLGERCPILDRGEEPGEGPAVAGLGCLGELARARGGVGAFG
jgi:hypothetical protein